MLLYRSPGSDRLCGALYLLTSKLSLVISIATLSAMEIFAIQDMPSRYASPTRMLGVQQCTNACKPLQIADLPTMAFNTCWSSSNFPSSNRILSTRLRCYRRLDFADLQYQGAITVHSRNGLTKLQAPWSCFCAFTRLHFYSRDLDQRQQLRPSRCRHSESLPGISPPSLEFCL